jgi:hypothetical protein
MDHLAPSEEAKCQVPNAVLAPFLLHVNQPGSPQFFAPFGVAFAARSFG